MKFPMYSYRDIKVGFGQPFCDQNDNTAMRGFSFAVFLMPYEFSS